MMSLLFFTIIMVTLAGSQAEFNGTLSVTIYASLGANVSIPCHMLHDDSVGGMLNGMRVKWTKVAQDESFNEDVLVGMGFHIKTYGNFDGRAFLERANDEDASLVLTDISKDDAGTYRCEIFSGMEEQVYEVALEVEGSEINGVVFPYSPPGGRYNLNFHSAEQACVEQGAVVASFDQLLEAWKGGLDWCNAGWLSDGTVQYPITRPRQPCGGNNGPGLRSYGRRDKKLSRYDVFCYASPLTGRFYWLVQPERLSYDEAVQACIDDGAEIAKVGQMYAAWKVESFDRCDAGWLADGSVRYPISRPRKNCSPTEAAVRIVGFPDKAEKLYGVYCYKEEQ
ncbi:hyaluronan and proteoglycan link protein 1-like [Periophthalmus magnuspinnatus]|uniref:hyaluronan and proteoglycan link protein 1-like n=1 Tax=Periophthalmus magnuspinnatus TaxID=409849 RepID=UPI00145A32D7|nr:hyaluronan and proteoglycan link protein 1-like [Periophthalmus magnuspinnatus]